ncbi:MAG: hypothetical protein LBS62_02775 [Clostridiales bacterium]|nr:hypothetical protein [Clostridiales bacterium]
MDNFETSLKLLLDILLKKKETLTQIFNITENQGTALAAAADGHKADSEELAAIKFLFDGMNDEKQVLIDKVINGDNVFQDIFSRLGAEFEERAEEQAELIRLLQSGIKDVMDLDVKIRLQERQNQMFISKGGSSGGKLNIPKATKSYMLDKYKNWAGMNKSNKERK